MITTEVYMDIRAYKHQGHSLRWIARKLGIHRKTVKLGSTWKATLPERR